MQNFSILCRISAYYAEFQHIMQNFSILNMNQNIVNRVIRVNRVKIELIYYAEFQHFKYESKHS